MNAAPHPTVAQLLDERAGALVGRDRELDALLALVERDRPLVAYVHGVAGAGKTTLVRAFAGRARALVAGELELELALVTYLYEREGQAVGRAELLRDVWGDEWQGGSNVIDVAISGLRRKLGDDASLIQTVRGVGYRMRPPADDGQAERSTTTSPS